MTETVLGEIVRRAVSDAAFRGQLRSDPAKALAGITLTARERTAASRPAATAAPWPRPSSTTSVAGVASRRGHSATGDTLLDHQRTDAELRMTRSAARMVLLITHHWLLIIP